VEIRSAANDGLMVGANGGDGVDIWNAAENGLYVRVAGNHGLRINSVAQNGIDIVNVGAYGIHIADSDADNFFAGDTGIGVSSPTNRLHVRDSISAAASAGNHVAQIENTSTGGSADVLVIKINELPEDIDGGNNFISFHGNSGSSLGAIQGNSAGSVVYAGTGADYAEYLAKIEPLELIEPGDILGVHQGRVTRSTQNADFLLAASTDALVAGNDPGEEYRDAYVLVSFIGQADLRVSGPVMAGDLIVASGNDDGVGVALSADRMDSPLIGQVVGQAWEANPDPRVKPVRSLVGLVQPQVLAHSLRNLETRLRIIESALDLQ
jgi:hypothetical protein